MPANEGAVLVRFTTRRILGVVGSVALAAAVAAGPVRADDGSDQQAFVDRINSLRAAHGVGPVVVDDRLVLVARTWAVHLAAADALAHNPRIGADVPPGWSVLGENVARSGHNVDAVEQAFEHSRDHLANLLDARFTSVGVGVVMKGDIMWVVEEFLAPGPAPAPAKANPAKVNPVNRAAAIRRYVPVRRPALIRHR